MQNLNAMRDRLAEQPMAETLIGLCLLLLAAFAADFIVRQVLVRLVRRAVARIFPTSNVRGSVYPIVRTLGRVAPALVIHHGVMLVPHLSPGATAVTRNVASAFVIITLAMSVAATLSLINRVYAQRPDAAARPIKGYLELAKILVFAVAAILAISALIERSPLLLLSGLGALAAVLMLVLKDTILSLVASVQLNANDMLRVGDWIEMPKLEADGDVVDIALHTVKVQNWDKTITTIPTWRLIAEPFKNWRGMQEAGGRRIKRSLLIDQTSVGFLDPEAKARLARFAVLDEYLERKSGEIESFNARLREAGRDAVNARRQTNLGAFRAYVDNYLRTHPRIHQQMTLLVRQLEPTPCGLPLEIYCFTSTVAWNDYEGIQSDIFDHLIAILPEFGLRLFQQPSGADLDRLGLARAA